MRDADLDADTDPLHAVFRSAAVREIERRAVAREGLDEDALMARASRAAWRCLLERWPQAQRIGIACGPGNNGGDGYVLAELACSSGRRVRVLRLGETVKPGPARRAAEAFRQAGGEILDFRAEDGLPQVDVWVDALFGIGLDRALDGAAAALVQALNHACSAGAGAVRAPLFALDMPSGIDADTGHAHGVAVRATLTLSFICAKPGLYTGRGRAAAGEVRVDALDLDPHVFEGIEPTARLVRPDRLAHWLPPRERDAHKGRFGHVLCIGGDHGYGGALALCAEAAHRAGAGLVSAATRAEHIPMLLARRPECMAHALGADDAPDALAALLNRASALAIGPGLGQGAWGGSLCRAVLGDAAPARRMPMVIDADALNLLARRDAVRLPNAVLTPHPGEAARLLGATVDEVERDRVQAARRLAARYDAAVILKGAGTVVMSPSTEQRASIPVIVDAGNPGMASGGMGDALTGIVAALLAQFCSTNTATARPAVSDASGDLVSTDADRIDGVFAAAVCGALLHSAAADRAARDGGERGLLASDLFPHVRRLANPEPLR